MALRLGWQGFAVTSVDVSQFLGGNHTVACRFMPQYPYGYFGTIFGNGSSAYSIGQGLFNKGTKKTSVAMAIGDQTRDYPAGLKPGVWHSLAVVRSGNEIRTYLDGVELSPKLGSPASVPAGLLVIGRVGIRQFYGLVADVAIFKRALGASEVQQLKTASLPSNTGNLHAFWSLDVNAISVDPKINAPLQLHGRADRVDTTPSRNSDIDRLRLPLPSQRVPLDLPFPAGEAWIVGQSCHDPDGSHSAWDAFCWDLARVNPPTRGAPMFTMAPGRVVDMLESSPSGPLPPGVTGNFVNVEHVPGEIAGYLHMLQNTVPLNKGDVVRLGQKVGETGNTGSSTADQGNEHVHVALSFIDSTNPTVWATLPSAFRDYEVSADGGQTWQSVDWGVPKAGDVVRNPERLAFAARSMFTGNAVSRKAGEIDVVAVYANGRVQAARWSDGYNSNLWDRWCAVKVGLAFHDSPATLVARHPDQLDVFVVGTDCGIWTAAQNRHVDGGRWGGWRRILDGVAAAGSAVSAVSRDPDTLDVFVVAEDGSVWTAAWNPNVEKGNWRGWGRILDGVAAKGGRVTAVSRHPNALDLFVIAPDGSIWTAAWDQNVAGGQWRGWAPVLNGVAAPGGSVAAVSRDPNKLDIFAIAPDGSIWTASWDQNAAKGQWEGWRPLPAGVADPAGSITAVSRDPGSLDVFVIGPGGGVFAAAWEAGVAKGQWRGWDRVREGLATQGSAVSVVSREPSRLDIFVIGLNGQVWTAAWDKAKPQWEGWWQVG